MYRIFRTAWLLFAFFFTHTAHAQSAWPVTEIRVAVKTDYSPVDFVDERGQYSGYAADLLRLLEQRLGVRFRLQHYPTLEAALQAVRNGQADMVNSVAQRPERESYLAFTEPLLKVEDVYITRRGHEFSSSRLSEEVFAVERGFAVGRVLAERYPKAQIKLFDSTTDALLAVANGQANVYSGALPTAMHLVDTLLLTDLQVAAPSGLFDGYLRIGVRKDWPWLVQNINRTLMTISPAERRALEDFWLPNRQLISVLPRDLILPRELREFLSVKRSLRIGYIDGQQPFHDRDNTTGVHGVAAQYVELINQRLGLAKSEWRSGQRTELAAALNAGEIDLLVLPRRWESQQTRFMLSGPFETVPVALVVHAEQAGERSLDALVGVPVVVDRSLASLPGLRFRYPKAVFWPVDDPHQAATLVAQKQVAAALIDANTLLNHLSAEVRAQVRPATIYNYPAYELYFAVRPDMPQLAQALDLVRASITPSEKSVIAQADANRHQTSIPWARWIRLGTGLLLVIALILIVVLWWNRRLQAEVQARKQAEARLAIERDNAQAAARAKSEFVATMSHEIRNPMAGLMGMMELLDRTALNPAQKRMLGVSRNAAQNLLNLLNQILNHSKLEAGRVQLETAPAHLVSLLEDVASQFSGVAFDKGLQLKLHIDPALNIPLLFDALRVRQIISNLVSNAVKFTEQGEVSLSAHVLPSIDGQRHVVIQVRDTGIGINAEEQSHLFKPFSQAASGGERVYGGSGLGLAICKQLAELMQGRLELHSTAGQGSEFRLTLQLAAVSESPSVQSALPLQDIRVYLHGEFNDTREYLQNLLQAAGAHCVNDSVLADEIVMTASAVADHPFTQRPCVMLTSHPAPGLSLDGQGHVRLAARPLLPSMLIEACLLALHPPAANPPQVAVREENHQRGKRVLIAEDDPINQLVITQFLMADGWDVVSAEDGEQAWLVFLREPFDVVLTDINMPKLDGISLARRIRELNPNIWLVALTGAFDDKDVPTYQQAGFNAWLAKPCSSAQLLQALRVPPAHAISVS